MTYIQKLKKLYKGSKRKVIMEQGVNGFDADYIPGYDDGEYYNDAKEV